MSDLISRQAAIDAVNTALFPKVNTAKDAEKALRALPSAQPETPCYLGSPCEYQNPDAKMPSAQPTIYGYNVEHLEMIARVLQKENLPPERVVEILADIGRIVAIIRDEFEDNLRKVIEQCMT